MNAPRTTTTHLAWPFFDDAHRVLGASAAEWVATQSVPGVPVDDACREWVRRLGAAGFLKYCVPQSWGGALPTVDSRALCVLRETFAAHDGLADFAFAMQGLGSGAITLGGSDALRAEWLPRVSRGEAIAAFALSEPDAGSDAAALRTRAERAPGGWRLSGTKTWISNGGIADFYCVFARTAPDASGTKGISAFFVRADTPGLSIGERIEVMSPHPLATLSFDGCIVPQDALLGAEGEGFALAMRTLDIFRVSVAAAATGFARRALREALSHAQSREMFGATLGAQPLAQAILGDMATDLDAAALPLWRDETGVEMLDGIGATELIHIFIAAAGDDVRLGAIGRAVPGYEVAVLDDDLVRVPNGTIGRLAVRGPTGCRYLADERQKAYVQGGWNLTGDACVMDDDGYVFFRARTDDLIISSGYNIGAPEVEAAVLQHDAVLECAVVGVPDPARGQAVKAFVVVKPGREATDVLAREIQEHVKTAIAPYKYPRHVEFVVALPKTDTGKLQRFRLKETT